MAIKMRFVQMFDKSDSEAFWALEKRFVELEKKTPEMKVGRRFVPVVGREPSNTMVWEAEYATMAEAMAALEAIEANTDHEDLFNEQVRYMRDNYVELYREVE